MHKIARIYLRVSTDEQDLSRQERIVEDARAAGYYVAGVYREKASGANMNRSELQRMIADLQPDDVIIAERIDRLSRLPLPEAQALIDTMFDLPTSKNVARVVVDENCIDAAQPPQLTLREAPAAAAPQPAEGVSAKAA